MKSNQGFGFERKVGQSFISINQQLFKSDIVFVKKKLSEHENISLLTAISVVYLYLCPPHALEYHYNIIEKYFT